MSSPAYSPPTIGPAGLTIPSYLSIQQFLLANFQNLYGPGVYLGTDSADYQFISVLALALSDCMQTIQLDYNNRAPNFAIGAALDSLVKINGLTRKVASASTCIVTIVGTPNTVITGGIVRDTVPGQGFSWDLPPTVTIPLGGTIDVIVVCETLGAVNALAGQISIILTPTAGWTSVLNAANAVLGQPVELDSQLRARQAVSTELPSMTTLAGTIAEIAATPGVTRYYVEENFTGSIDANGCPPHSITAVVEGGTDQAVAQAIFNNRGIGPFTNGTTTVGIIDPVTLFSVPISFDRPTYVPIYVTMNVHLFPGGTSDIFTVITQAVTAYLNSLQIGEVVTLSAIYAVAMTATPNIATPLFSIRGLFIGLLPGPSGTADIPMLFNQVAQAATIQINTV